MNKEIIIEDILKFQKEYQKNPNHKDLETKINNLGLSSACLNEELTTQYEYNFNIEIPETKIYDQKRSYQCNIYAFLRVVKSIAYKNNPETIDMDLSAKYLDFFDKLEKINTLYNELIEQKNLTIELINEKVDRYIELYGTFHFARELFKKYGIVPTKEMAEANDNYNATEILEILKMKIKTDALILLNPNINKEKTKRQLLKEAYNFLSLVMGNPPSRFKYKKEMLTPIKFKEKYFNTNLDNFITLTSYKKETLQESFAFIPNVYLNDQEEIKTVSVETMKKVVLEQLKNGIAVWFSAEESTALDYETNILDLNTFKYHELFQIKNIPKEEKLKLDLINYDHAMAITGALLENYEIKQFKVDNSFGLHGKYKGHLIMTNSFFENCVITIIIDKKYLDELEILTSQINPDV